MGQWELGEYELGRLGRSLEAQRQDRLVVANMLLTGAVRIMTPHRLAGADIDVVGHLLLGALNEAAMLVARASVPARARREAMAAVDRLIEGFFPALGSGGPRRKGTGSARRGGP